MKYIFNLLKSMPQTDDSSPNDILNMDFQKDQQQQQQHQQQQQQQIINQNKP